MIVGSMKLAFLKKYNTSELFEYLISELKKFHEGPIFSFFIARMSHVK